MKQRLFTIAAGLSLGLVLATAFMWAVDAHYHRYTELLQLPLPAPANEGLLVWDGPTHSLYVLWAPAIRGQYGASSGIQVPGWFILVVFGALPLVRFSWTVQK